MLYSGDSKYVKGVAESPGPQNGWNRTLYSWDPHHAGGLIVAESPAPRNGWNGLVLRSKNAAISVIVVDWSATRFKLTGFAVAFQGAIWNATPAKPARRSRSRGIRSLRRIGATRRKNWEQGDRASPSSDAAW